jgi:4-hydroxy-tetrahydrodipicolinate reductase
VGTRAQVELETSAGVVGTATMEFRVLHEGEHEYAGWSVDGRPSASIRTAREDTAHATASCIVNRIPDVIAAVPGIVLVSEMGPMRHSAPF